MRSVRRLYEKVVQGRLQELGSKLTRNPETNCVFQLIVKLIVVFTVG